MVSSVRQRWLFTVLLCLLMATAAQGGEQQVLPKPEPAARAASESFAVMVVMLYDNSCHKYCAMVRPIMHDLQNKFGERMKYVELDTSTNVLKDTEKSARALGVFGFLSSATDYVPVVGIFTPPHKLIKELPGAKEQAVYESWIEKACKQTTKN